MSEDPIALSRRCEEAARRQAALHRELARFGPFEALLDRDDDMIWLNYAVPAAPLPDAAGARAALAGLAEHFAARGRRLRFEFHARPWPGLPELLEAAGLQLQARHPLMVCAPGELRPRRSAGVAVRRLTPDSPDADLDALGAVQAAGFGETAGVMSDGRRRQMRDAIASGSTLYGLALVDGAPAGAAALLPFDGVGELAGVATLPALRRRGVAATLCSALSEAFFAAGGGLAWLSAGDEVARAVYAQIGYRLIDERLNYIA